MPESDRSSLGIRKTKTLKLEGKVYMDGSIKDTHNDKVLSIWCWCVLEYMGVETL